MRIDVHAHYYCQELGDGMKQFGAQFPLASASVGGGVTLDERIELMDDAGIDVQVLCTGSQQPYQLDAGKMVGAARFANDYYKRVVDAYNGRFAAFGCVPLPSVDEAIAEASRCLDQLGFAGINLGCSIAGRAPDDPAFEPFWAELDRRRTTVFFHPLGTGMPLGDAYGLSWMVGGCFEDTITALRLAMSGLTARFPSVKIIVPHLGGTLPFLWQRIADSVERRRITRPEGNGAETGAVESPIDALRRMYYDTVNESPAALQCTCQTIGASQVMLGTDFPYLAGPKFKRCVTYVQESGLPEDQVEAILDRNAQELLKLPQPKGRATGKS